MKSIIRKIDRAIKRLYNLDSRLSAEDFLVVKPQPGFQGALLVHSEQPNQISVGIYLNESVRRSLRVFPKGRSAFWSKETLSAFTVATEEVSHFHYLLHHVTAGRPVSQLEMELQGDIDKFLVAYFAN